MPQPILISDWTVDYGQGPQPCTVPHAWRQDVDVRWEGPAIYRTRLTVTEEGGWLVFGGVSYAAKVTVTPFLLIEEEGGRGMEVPAAFEHLGIWDAFKVPLQDFAGQELEITVEVVKNGGNSFPVRDVASGFLPFVFNTFGGIWQKVELYEEEPDLELPAPPTRVRVDGTKVFVDGKPFYMRGVLTWGWYPELGNHPCPDDDLIRREVRIMKELGFNTCKFCLWVPPHRYFEILEEEGMFAWLELPLWDPTPDPEKQESMFEELRRITLQYRRHSNIVAWTCGCELSSNTTAEFRRRLYEMVKELTGSPLVKDNSGSSEMYGGDLREYGDFYDFHPYCDLPFYPVVLDSLLVGPREKKPILLGEFNDIDVVRDLPRLKKERPFWTSSDPHLNDQGVRWEKPELPRILDETKWAELECPELRQSSLHKALFIRRFVQQAVRAREDIAGYVITGWRDTPISTSGMVDDWGEPHMPVEGFDWNQADILFSIPFRTPPWVDGGNRPGWRDTYSYEVGPVVLQVGVASEAGVQAELRTAVDQAWEGERIEQQNIRISAKPNKPELVYTFHFETKERGDCAISAHSKQITRVWMANVWSKPDWSSYTKWRAIGRPFPATLQANTGPHLATIDLPPGVIDSLHRDLPAVAILLEQAIQPSPFWRESANEFVREGLWEWTGNWEALISVSGDRVIDLDALRELLPDLTDVEVLINRVDTRTYREAPILIRAKVGRGTLVATTLRPFGGLGVQPYGVMNNPAGADLLVKLMALAERKDALHPLP